MEAWSIIMTVFFCIFWQYANLANTLLGVIWEKVLAIAPKWSDIPKVEPYRCLREFYAES